MGPHQTKPWVKTSCDFKFSKSHGLLYQGLGWRNHQTEGPPCEDHPKVNNIVNYSRFGQKDELPHVGQYYRVCGAADTNNNSYLQGFGLLINYLKNLRCGANYVQ